MKLRSCALLLVGVLTLAVAPLASAATYDVTIEDLVPGGPATGQPISPPVAVVHGPGYSMFDVGAMATPGLSMVAEDGATATLVAEAMANGDVGDVQVGAGPFFDSVTVMVNGMPGDRLSIAAMLGRTNDLFTGGHDAVLPAVGSTVIMTNAYDAGTEVNTGLIEHIPFYGNGFVGPDESNPIAMANSYTIANDPDYGVLEFTFPPVARITVTRTDPTATASTTWGGIRGLYR